MTLAEPVLRDGEAPASPLRLRVLDGRLAGAEHRLPDGRAVRVGHAFENDIVLRGPATRRLSAELHRDGDTVLMRVLSGEAIVLGRTLNEGEEALLPPYLPVRLGDYAFAVGGGDDARWVEAGTGAATLARSTPAVLQPRTHLAQRATARLDPLAGWGRRLLARPGRLAFAVFAGVALASAAVVGTSMFTLDTSDPVAVQATLTEAGFPGLLVKPDPTGTLLITGVVADDADLARLQAVAARRVPGAKLEVDSTEALAAAAGDLLATQRVDATAAPDRRPGTLLVTGEYLPIDRQAQLTGMLRADVPGIRGVRYRIDPAKGGDRLRAFFNSPEYGAASFVDGDPGFLLTADGSRWFKGATLPTGHRIVEVGSGRLLVEKGGRVEAVVM